MFKMIADNPELTNIFALCIIVIAVLMKVSSGRAGDIVDLKRRAVRKDEYFFITYAETLNILSQDSRVSYVPLGATIQVFHSGLLKRTIYNQVDLCNESYKIKNNEQVPRVAPE